MPRLLVLLILTGAAFQATAGLFGSDVKLVSEIKAMYETMKKTLHEAKITNEQLHNVKTAINDIIETKQTIDNFDADRIARRIANDMAGVTQMDNLAGMNSRQRIRAVQRMLDRRIAAPDTSRDDKARYEREHRLLGEIGRRNDILDEMNQNATKNLAQSSQDISTRDSSRISAEALSTLVEIESRREIHANDGRSEKLRDTQQLHQLNQEFLDILENSKDSGW